MHSHAVVLGGALTLTFLNHLILQTRSSHLHLLALGVLGKISFTGFAVNLLGLLFHLGEKAVNHFLSLFHSHLGTFAGESSLHAIGEILIIEGSNARAAEVVAHRQTKSIADFIHNEKSLLYS